MKYLILFALISVDALGYTVGAQQFERYKKLVANKNVALVVNQTSRVGDTHLIDYLLSKKVKVSKLFALEHGIRGNLDAGEDVQDGIDVKTGLPVISLYGKNKEPKKEDLKDIDIIIFDIQDVGVRFYTYISSLAYVLKSCAKNSIKCVVLDRPNPNVNNVKGPVLDLKEQSFLGMFPIPVLYGLTIGELTRMMVNEGWIAVKPDYEVITIANYNRALDRVKLRYKPSPNLPNDISIKWYATLALFEPTVMSIGRGTQIPFQVIGYPDKKFGNFSFTPKSIIGMSKYPKHENKKCFGVDLRKSKPEVFTLKYLVEYFQVYGKEGFFKHENFFNKLIGNNQTLKDIKSGVDYLVIEKGWEKDLNKYRALRKKYLIYE